MRLKSSLGRKRLLLEAITPIKEGTIRETPAMLSDEFETLLFRCGKGGLTLKKEAASRLAENLLQH